MYGKLTFVGFAILSHVALCHCKELTDPMDKHASVTEHTFQARRRIDGIGKSKKNEDTSTRSKLEALYTQLRHAMDQGIQTPSAKGHFSKLDTRMKINKNPVGSSNMFTPSAIRSKQSRNAFHQEQKENRNLRPRFDPPIFPTDQPDTSPRNLKRSPNTVISLQAPKPSVTRFQERQRFNNARDYFRRKLGNHLTDAPTSYKHGDITDESLSNIQKWIDPRPPVLEADHDKSSNRGKHNRIASSQFSKLNRRFHIDEESMGSSKMLPTSVKKTQQRRMYGPIYPTTRHPLHRPKENTYIKQLILEAPSTKQDNMDKDKKRWGNILFPTTPPSNI